MIGRKTSIQSKKLSGHFRKCLISKFHLTIGSWHVRRIGLLKSTPYQTFLDLRFRTKRSGSRSISCKVGSVPLRLMVTQFLETHITPTLPLLSDFYTRFAKKQKPSKTTAKDWESVLNKPVFLKKIFIFLIYHYFYVFAYFLCINSNYFFHIAQAYVRDFYKS